MAIFEIWDPYCKFVKGVGYILDEDAPIEVTEAFENWKETRRPQPDENGIVTIVD